MTKLIIFLIVIAGAVAVIEFIRGKSKGKPDVSLYEKKLYLFDVMTELALFRTLLELYGDKYHVFPQINYSHLIKPKKTTFELERKYRSSIDRKSADFVLCDKESVVPVLVIELDGYVHNFKDRKSRDQFIDSVASVSGLPLVHIKTTQMDKESVKQQIDIKLKI